MAYRVNIPGTATPQPLASSGSAGTSSQFAPIDHVHANTSPTGLTLAKWNQSDLSQWSNSGASRFSGSNITSGDFTMGAVTAGRGGYGKIPCTSNIVSSATTGNAVYLFDDAGAIATLNRFRARMVLANAVNTTGSGQIGFLFGSTNASGSGLYGLGLCQTISSGGIVAHKIEAGVTTVANGTVTGTTAAIASDGGLIWEMDVEVVPTVVTNPDVAWTSWTNGTSSLCTRGNTIGPAGNLYASYTGWNGLSINRIGLFFSWSTNNTHAVTFDLCEFQIMRHPMDW